MATKIEWTNETWNPTTGCTKISPGCHRCYAEAMAKRLQMMGVQGYEKGFELTLHEQRLEQPFKRKKATTYFVNSMSDLFHEDVPFEFIQKVFDVMDGSPHRFQVLTKRAKRMKEFFRDYHSYHAKTTGLFSLHNVWLGISVEDKKYGLPRVEYLRTINTHNRFLSIEPLLEDLGEINLSGIGWVIVGGESGPKARPMQKEWVESIQRQCEKAKVPFFFKQWGTWGPDGVKRNKKKNGCLLNGKTYREFP